MGAQGGASPAQLGTMAPAVTSDGTATGPYRLFQPLSQRYYLVVASLVCRRVGMPDRAVRPSKGERTTFVVRRLAATAASRPGSRPGPPATPGDPPSGSWNAAPPGQLVRRGGAAAHARRAGRRLRRRRAPRPRRSACPSRGGAPSTTATSPPARRERMVTALQDRRPWPRCWPSIPRRRKGSPRRPGEPGDPAVGCPPGHAAAAAARPAARVRHRLLLPVRPSRPRRLAGYAICRPSTRPCSPGRPCRAARRPRTCGQASPASTSAPGPRRAVSSRRHRAASWPTLHRPRLSPSPGAATAHQLRRPGHRGQPSPAPLQHQLRARRTRRRARAARRLAGRTPAPAAAWPTWRWQALKEADVQPARARRARRDDQDRSGRADVPGYTPDTYVIRTVFEHDPCVPVLSAPSRPFQLARVHGRRRAGAQDPHRPARHLQPAPVPAGRGHRDAAQPAPGRSTG